MLKTKLSTAVSFLVFYFVVERAYRIVRELDWVEGEDRDKFFLLALLANANANANPNPACFAFASFDFSFACVNREPVNSLVKNSRGTFFDYGILRPAF